MVEILSTGLMRATDAAARMDADPARETSAYSLGIQAVQWGMQWVKGWLVFHAMTAPLPEGTERAAGDSFPHGVNVWGHARALMTPEFRAVETPNTETLYSTVLIDIAAGPMIVVHPEFGGRYYRTSIWELHGDTHAIGGRTYGSHPPPLAIVPLGWNGAPPEGVAAIKVRSRYTIVGPHIAVYGPDDLPAVYELQDQLKLFDLAGFSAGTEAAPGPAMRPAQRPGSSTPLELRFFEELGELLRDLTVRDDELGFARQLRRIGLTLDDGFHFDELDEPTVRGLERAMLDGESILQHRAETNMPEQPGGTWLVGDDVTSVEDWLGRGGTGWGYVWGDDPKEIYFPFLRQDANRETLTSETRYTLRFAPGELPPARYWRISMYDAEGFFTDNPIDRYGIGNMAEQLDPDPDGGLTILLQHDRPGPDRETNWLPAPEGRFFLVMRMYQPDERMYRGEYILPPAVPVDGSDQEGVTSDG
jgi:hypothetical protein